MAGGSRSCLPARILALLAGLLLLGARPARAEGVDEEFQLWAPIVLQVELVPDRLAAYGEVQLRVFDDAQRLGQVVYRPALGVWIAEPVSLWLGFDRVETHAGPYLAENVLWEQVLIEHSPPGWRRLALLYRLRVEHRFVRHHDPVGHRVRVMARAAWPLALDDRLQAVVWDEVFVQLNDIRGVTRRGFDQNRFFLGPAFVLVEDHARLEVGYANLFFNRQGGTDLMAHALWITVRFDI